MRAAIRRIIVTIGLLGGIRGMIPHVGFIATVEAQDRTSFRPVLSKAIAAAVKSNFVDLRGNLRENLGDNLHVYGCDLLLPGSATCAVYLYDGIEGLKNSVVWDYGEGKTREAAELLFVELVDNVTQGMPSDWVGRETLKSNLGTRKLREFMASAKSDRAPIGGPIITISVTRLAELFAVKVELNSHHAD